MPTSSDQLTFFAPCFGMSQCSQVYLRGGLRDIRWQFDVDDDLICDLKVVLNSVSCAIVNAACSRAGLVLLSEHPQRIIETISNNGAETASFWKFGAKEP